MRIVHILLTSRFAGTERHVVDLVNAQAAQGHEVYLILKQKATQASPDAIAYRVSNNVKIEIVNNLFSSYFARKKVLSIQPDIAHAHLSGACHALSAIKKPFINKQTQKIIGRVATLHIYYKSQQHAKLDGLIAIAPWQIVDIPDLLQKNSIAVDNWVIPHLVSPNARQQLRQQYNIQENEFVFGALGRAEDSKGLDILIQAFQNMAIPNTRLVIVGQGKSWKKLRQQAHPNIIMPGFSDKPQDWLAAFDTFVSAARSEPFGLVFLEAMQAGLPIICSATEGAKHLAPIMQVNPLLIGDINLLQQELIKYAELKPARREYPMHLFSIEDKLQKIEDFYYQINKNLEKNHS